MHRYAAAALFIALGATLIAVGWILEDEGYVSSMLLEIGAAVLLVAPLILVERVITREIAGVRNDLDRIREQARPIAEPYVRLRAGLPTGPARTATMEEIIARARYQGVTGEHDIADVSALMATGDDGERIFAVGLMQGNHALASPDAVIAAIADSRSAFELYHGLRLALDVWSQLGSVRRELLDAIDDRERRGYLDRGSDRYPLAAEIRSRAASPNG